MVINLCVCALYTRFFRLKIDSKTSRICAVCHLLLLYFGYFYLFAVIKIAKITLNQAIFTDTVKK